MTRKQTVVATQTGARPAGSERDASRARKRPAADQLLELAARTQDPALRQVLLRQVAHLREVALSRMPKMRRA